MMTIKEQSLLSVGDEFGSLSFILANRLSLEKSLFVEWVHHTSSSNAKHLVQVSVNRAKKTNGGDQ